MYAVSQDRLKTELISVHSLNLDNLLTPKYKAPIAGVVPGATKDAAKGAKPARPRLSKVGGPSLTWVAWAASPALTCNASLELRHNVLDSSCRAGKLSNGDPYAPVRITILPLPCLS